MINPPDDGDDERASQRQIQGGARVLSVQALGRTASAGGAMSVRPGSASALRESAEVTGVAVDTKKPRMVRTGVERAGTAARRWQGTRDGVQNRPARLCKSPLGRSGSEASLATRWPARFRSEMSRDRARRC